MILINLWNRCMQILVLQKTVLTRQKVRRNKQRRMKRMQGGTKRRQGGMTSRRRRTQLMKREDAWNWRLNFEK